LGINVNDVLGFNVSNVLCTDGNEDLGTNAIEDHDAGKPLPKRWFSLFEDPKRRQDLKPP
jgi:hypothetical protein